MTDNDCTCVCQVCGTPYAPTRNKDGSRRKTKYAVCSKVCANAAYNAARYATKKRVTSSYEKDCAWCSASFVGAQATALYCSSGCKEKAKQSKRQPKLKLVVCAHCHQDSLREVRGSKDAGRYCSRQCAFDRLAVVARERKALRRIASVCRRNRRAAERAEAAAKRTIERPAPNLARVCIECGCEFRQVTHLGAPKTRCAACDDKVSRNREREYRRDRRRRGLDPKNHRQRARKHGAEFDPAVTSLGVFERDGWRCMLCGQSTPKRLRGTYEARAPELDHVVPLSAGGGHTWSNVQCACRQCNGRKGSEPLGQLGLGFSV